MWHVHVQRHINPWAITENHEINPHKSGQLIFDKLTNNTQWEKIVSSINDAEKTGHPYAKESFTS